MNEFEKSLSMGKAFEDIAKYCLGSIFNDCNIVDTSEQFRVHGRKYPDFEIYRNGKLIYLYDAKFKKLYPFNNPTYLPIDTKTVEDYKYHAAKANVPCGIIFGLHVDGKENQLYYVQDIEVETNFIVEYFDNQHGKGTSNWYDHRKLFNISLENH